MDVGIAKALKFSLESIVQIISWSVISLLLLSLLYYYYWYIKLRYYLFTLLLSFWGSTNDTNKLPVDSMSPIIYLFREKYPMSEWWKEWFLEFHSLGVLRKSENTPNVISKKGLIE